MPKRVGLAAVLLAASLVQAAGGHAAAYCLPESDAEIARVAVVADARTLRLVDGRTLRLAGIEPIAALYADGAAASAADAALVDRLQSIAGAAEIHFTALGESDRYGRLPALIEHGGQLLQEALIAEGLAVAFAAGTPIPCFEVLLAAEAQARQQGRGFWADAAVPFAIPVALEARTGLFTIFEGIVLTVGNRPSRTYLNFGRRWSDDVTVEIPAAERSAFGGEEGLATMAGQRVRVRGVLEARNGPLMTVTSPNQIELLGRAGIALPPALSEAAP
jgi:endonuclease YncB( thermonuclease family)